jgi:flagellar basal body-associated protein FliL
MQADKKNKKILLIVIIVLIICALASIAVFLYIQKANREANINIQPTFSGRPDNLQTNQPTNTGTNNQ